MTVRVKRLRLYLSVCLGVCLWISLVLPLYVRYDFTEPSAVPSAEEHTTRSSRVHVKKVQFDEDILPQCENPPTEVNTTFFKYMRRFTGRKMMLYTAIYPSDGTKLRGRRRGTEANEIIPSKVVSNLKSMYQSALKHRNTDIDVCHVERTTLFSSLVIYFIDTRSSDNASEPQIKHFVSIQHGALCCLPAYRVDLRRTVVVVATSMNLGPAWIRHFINEFSEIIEQTKEQNFRIILSDFTSGPNDIQRLFDESILKERAKVINMNMHYNKPIGVEKAVELVQNPDDIIFLCDFHIEIPLGFINMIRKHVIAGHMVFAPVVAKLNEETSIQDKEGKETSSLYVMLYSIA
ncbi:uncharacterized protein [Asterias amurensis]|uniref:uncharacterized protein n=1 Tax=Asterias amurensis TaxID=7602 RepID=UPI003AB260DA